MCIFCRSKDHEDLADEVLMAGTRVSFELKKLEESLLKLSKHVPHYGRIHKGIVRYRKEFNRYFNEERERETPNSNDLTDSLNKAMEEAKIKLPDLIIPRIKREKL